MGKHMLSGLIVCSGLLLDVTPAAPVQAAQETAAPAQVRVIVPPEAKVFIQGVLTRQQGQDRLFVSPVLAGGRTYCYTVRASWVEKGREVSQERQVFVRAGQEVLVEFAHAGTLEERPLSPPLAPEPKAVPAEDQPLVPPIAPEPRTHS